MSKSLVAKYATKMVKNTCHIRPWPLVSLSRFCRKTFPKVRLNFLLWFFLSNEAQWFKDVQNGVDLGNLPVYNKSNYFPCFFLIFFKWEHVVHLTQQQKVNSFRCQIRLMGRGTKLSNLKQLYRPQEEHKYWNVKKGLVGFVAGLPTNWNVFKSTVIKNKSAIKGILN